MLTNLLTSYSYVPVILLALYALKVYKGLESDLKKFSWFIFLSAVVEITALTLWNLKTNNLPILHLYVIVGFICITWFYSDVLAPLSMKKTIRVITILFTAFALVNAFFIQGVYHFGSYSLVTESILIVILAGYTLIQLYQHQTMISQPSAISLKWINLGLLVYYTTYLLQFFVSILAPSTNSKEFFLYVTISSLVMYSLIFVGLWKRPKIVHP